MDITNIDAFLENLRLLARKIADAADADQRIDANACVGLAKGFQELDAWLAQGGDAPVSWTS